MVRKLICPRFERMPELTVILPGEARGSESLCFHGDFRAPRSAG